jgi:hypothetical protein
VARRKLLELLLLRSRLRGDHFKAGRHRMLSLFCLLLVVAQPTVNANRDMTLIVLNEVRIFIFVGSFQFCGCLEDGFADKKEFMQGL